MRAKQRTPWFMGLLVLGLTLPSVARTEELPAWLTERRIIGNNDLERIERVRDTDAYAKARVVARVERSDGMGFCTGSRVGENLFLTNFHCYEFSPCETLQFHLGYEAELPVEDQLYFKCKAVLAKNETYDYALYRVEFVGTGAGGAGETQTHTFHGLDAAIPDDDAAGISPTFAIPQSGAIADLKVRVKIEHTWIGDLRIKLTSPLGTVVTLADASGDDGDNLDVTFTINDGLRPFLGEEASGDWLLSVVDTAAQDTGVLQEVDFIVTTAITDERITEGGTPADYPIATLWAGAIAVDQELLVAGHPAARQKEIDRSATCKLRTIEPEDMEGRKTITHTCDTEGGSSGSPVLDRATGSVVALHWGGTDEYNLSIPMSLVVQDIEANVSADDFSELTIER